MVDVTGLGMSTDTEEESVQELNQGDEEVSDSEAFLEIWNVLGEAMLENADPDELSDFLGAASAASSIAVDLTAYADDDDSEGVSLYDTFDFEPGDEEDDEEPIDDLESCDCGDSDEN